jgi:Phasin protein
LEPLLLRNHGRVVPLATEIHQMSNHQMSNHPTKPGGKSNSRARKVDPPRKQKPDQAPGPNPAQQPDLKRPLEAAIAAPDTAPAVPAMAPPDAPSAVAPPTTPSAVAPAPTLSAVPPATPPAAMALATTPPIDFQIIATAYSDYTRKSLEQTRSFAEKLAGVRSLDKAIEIQTEFARQAYETFVTESQKIRELYSVLARQSFERTFAKLIPAAH